MHPEVVGRGHRVLALDRLIGEMTARGKVWFATHAQVAEVVLGRGAR